jgi:hypothetical protein
MEIPKVMVEPFPALTHLDIFYYYHPPLVLPNTFLGGSAPRLQCLKLWRIPFLTLPELLLSTSELVHLILHAIPTSGYISPDAMVTGLSALTRLATLTIQFELEASLSRGNAQVMQSCRGGDLWTL